MSRDEIIACGGMIATLLLVIAIVTFVPKWPVYRCAQTWPDRETRWSFAGGCQVKINGQYQPELNLRVAL